MKHRVREITAEIAAGRVSPDAGASHLIEELLGRDAERFCFETGVMSPRGAQQLMTMLKERE